MDTLRGRFDSPDETAETRPAGEAAEGDQRPGGIGTDERRLQVRAYNHWASLLHDRRFPAIEELEPRDLPDFGDYSVLLDFTAGAEHPAIAYLGAELAAECGIELDGTASLADVHSRSLLTRITNHYQEILANQAPVGFEAEFVNQRGKAILYRGILLPYSSDNDTIDFIHGVINWKELAEQRTADELLLEIEQALDHQPPRVSLLELPGRLTDWADGPGGVPAGDVAPANTEHALPRPSFGYLGGKPAVSESALSGELDGAFELGGAMRAGDDELESQFDDSKSTFASLAPAGPAALASAPRKKPIVLGMAVPGEPPLGDMALDDFAYQAETSDGAAPLDASAMALGDWLAAAREMAAAARSSEDRTRGALYKAIGRAYDFSLAASGAGDQFASLLGEAGLAMQDRAPMTPVVKLVFGADYDKTRLTEFASALSFATREDVDFGGFEAF
ncbi:MAG: hypothetical protein ABIP41_04555, partial [Croceibacterium sp.]